MTTADYLRKLAAYNSLDFLSVKGKKDLYDALRACAELVDSCGTERHTCTGRNRRGSNCAICKALAALEAMGKGK